MNGNGHPQAVLYARWSPRPERKNSSGKVVPCASNEVQVAKMREWCAAEGLEVREPPAVVAALSGGTDLEDNPALWGALISLKRGDTLVVYALDRLARSLLNQLLFIREAERRGAMVRSLAGEGTDDETFDGEMVRNILGSVNERNRKASAARTSAYMRRYQSEGRRMTPIVRVPYGSCADPADPSRLIANPPEAAALARMLELAREGLTPGKIVKRLDSEGYNARCGKWHRQVIRHILRRELENPTALARKER